MAEVLGLSGGMQSVLIRGTPDLLFSLYPFRNLSFSIRDANESAPPSIPLIVSACVR
jgi:hypothetical protein